MNSLSPVESFTRFTCFNSIIFADINWLTGSCLIVSNPSITFADTLANGACFVGAGLVGWDRVHRSTSKRSTIVDISLAAFDVG